MTTRVRASILAITFGAILALPTIAAAQSPVTIGVKAGVNIAKLSGEDDDDEDTKSLVGAVGGLFVGKQINDTFGIRVEGLFSQKGVKNAEQAVDDFKYKLTYIDVPVLLTLGPSSSTDTRFNVFTGPQFSFKTKAEFEENGVDFDADDIVKSSDLGWVLGVGMEKGRVTADARYTLGLSNISELSGDDIKNKVFSVMIGIKLK
jgi:hypothetical protein